MLIFVAPLSLAMLLLAFLLSLLAYLLMVCRPDYQAFFKKAKSQCREWGSCGNGDERMRLRFNP